jgi:hypothetical protein
MTTETFRDSCQRILGYIETRSDSIKIGRDVYHRIKGYYDPRSNITRGANGVLIGYGDEPSSLILNSQFHSFSYLPNTWLEKGQLCCGQD